MIKQKSRRKDESEDNKQPGKKLKNQANISVKTSAWPSSVQNKTNENTKKANLKTKHKTKIGPPFHSNGKKLIHWVTLSPLPRIARPISVLCFVLRFGFLYFYQFYSAMMTIKQRSWPKYLHNFLTFSLAVYCPRFLLFFAILCFISF